MAWLKRLVSRISFKETIEAIRSRWRWILPGIVLGLGLLYLRGLLAPAYDPDLPSMREPERLLALLVDSERTVRTVVVYPLEERGSATQLVTFELRDAARGGEWRAYKAWIDVPVADRERTVEDYVARARAEGTLTVAVRSPGWREAHLSTCLILALSVIVAMLAGPRLAEVLRAARASRQVVAESPRPAHTSGSEEEEDRKTDTIDNYEFQQTAAPMEHSEIEPAREHKQYEGLWYPVARKSKKGSS